MSIVMSVLRGERTRFSSQKQMVKVAAETKSSISGDLFEQRLHKAFKFLQERVHKADLGLSPVIPTIKVDLKIKNELNCFKPQHHITLAFVRDSYQSSIILKHTKYVSKTEAYLFDFLFLCLRLLSCVRRFVMG